MKQFNHFQYVKISILLIFFIINLSCFSLSGAKSDTLKITVTGTVKTHHPYCGGASPTPEMERGSFSVVRNTEFHLVKKGDTSRTSILKFKTDDKGHFEFEIEAGEYSIFKYDKMLSFDDFYNAYSTPVGSFNVSVGIDCYREWYNKPDYKLNVSKDTNIEIIFYAGCFTGINPCVNYTGPCPP